MLMTAIDVAAHLGAVSRVVEHRALNGETMIVVIASRAYDTSVDDLWDAITDKARLVRWFAQVDGELEMGGRFHIKNNASGTVTACEPRKSFSATWEFGGGVSWINVALTPTKDGGAYLTVEHLAPPNPHWDKFGAGAGGVGWELGLLGLGMHTRSREARDKFDEHVWGLSEEGKSFVSAAGAGWIEAEIASGEDKAEATKRGQRTIAFYRGEPFDHI
jgi:uncharacterized protein YndB with AHSA1/START domain